jgi:hypothetical protein
MIRLVKWCYCVRSMTQEFSSPMRRTIEGRYPMCNID